MKVCNTTQNAVRVVPPQTLSFAVTKLVCRWADMDAGCVCYRSVIERIVLVFLIKMGKIVCYRAYEAVDD
jgi:hypothetical protein